MSSSKASFAIRFTLKVEESSRCSMNRSPPVKCRRLLNRPAHVRSERRAGSDHFAIP